MRKQRVQWLVAACLLCLAQPAWAASDSITYQDSLDSISESYPGELQQPSTPERSNIRVVRRGASPITAPTEKLPTRVDADKMTYSGSTGDVNAFGNVVVTQGNRTLLANRITGNTKTTEYRTADGPYRYLEDGGKTKDLTGDDMTYRTSDQHFDAGHTQGWSDPYYVKGQNLSYDGQTGSIEKGMITSKHAMAFKHTPDYRIEGEDIKIYPGDKVVIQHPSFYIKNFKLFSLKSYTKSIIVMMALDCVVMQKFHWVNLVKRILITNGIQKPDLSLKLDIAISYLGELHPSGIVKYPMNIMMKLYG